MADKVVTDQIWYTDDGKMVNVGFTRSFLDRMAECWHVMPAHTSRVREKSPLITIESNEEMFSIPSPITGNIRNFSDKASNFPDRLVETDVICQIVRGEATAAKQKAFKPAPPAMDTFNPFAEPPRGIPEPPRARATLPAELRERIERMQQEDRQQQVINEVRATLRQPVTTAAGTFVVPRPAAEPLTQEAWNNFLNDPQGNI